MGDPRIERLVEAAQAMRRGHFSVELPTGADDEVARLTAALAELGSTLERKFEELAALSRVTERINAGLLIEDVLGHVYDSFRPIIPYDRIGFSLIDQDGATVRAIWARSDAPGLGIGAGYAAALAGSSLEPILESGVPRVLNDLEAYLREHPQSDSTRRVVEEGMRSSLTCPIMAMGKRVGFLFFSSRQKGTYADLHVQLFQQIAGQLSTIVEKSRLYQELLELNQLKNKFLGIAAHDLRSPIAAIKGTLSLLVDGLMGPLTGEQRELLAELSQAASHMQSLVEDLLDVTAIEAGSLVLRPILLPLGDFLQACAKSGRRLAAAKSMSLELELAPNLPEVCLDPDRMEQVMSNLVGNAIKFSHPGSPIRIVARGGDGEALVTVEDRGQGIAKAEIEKLFQPFARTSTRPTAGEQTTGLGLAIVKRIVEAHGGRVEVESEPGRGSSFRVRLPLTPTSE